MTDITTTLTAVGREIDKAFADHAKERERLSSLLANERQDRKRADQKTIRFLLSMRERIRELNKDRALLEGNVLNEREESAALRERVLALEAENERLRDELNARRDAYECDHCVECIRLDMTCMSCRDKAAE